MANTFDGDNLIITLEAVVGGVLTVNVLEDLYEDAKDWYRAHSDNRRFPFPFVSDGGNPLTAIIDQGAYIFLDNVSGWTIKPFENDGTYFFIGNLAVLDTEIEPLTPTDGAFTTAIFGLQPVTQGVIPEMKDNLRSAIYQNAAWLSQSGGITGIEFPKYSSRAPGSLLSEAKTVAVANGFLELDFKGDYVFDAADDVDGYILRGDGGGLTKLTFPAGASTNMTRFRTLKLTGDLQGALEAIECNIETVTDVGGTEDTEFTRCYIEPGTAVTMSASATGLVSLRDCDSGSPGDTPVTYDWNGSAVDAVFRKYAGGIKLENITQGNELSIDGDGHLVIAATCTSCTIAVHGDMKITNLASGNPGVVIIDQATYTRLNELWQVLGLDPDSPLEVDEDGTIRVGSIVINANTIGTTPTRTTTQTRA